MGTQMKTIATVDSSGVIHNIGKWELTTENGVDHPFPEDCVEGEFDIELTADGRYVLATDYKKLRAAEYPSIGDQLDALFKVGLFPAGMAEQIALIKAKYPKQ
jgi:hypothetical protein